MPIPARPGAAVRCMRCYTTGIVSTIAHPTHFAAASSNCSPGRASTPSSAPCGNRASWRPLTGAAQEVAEDRAAGRTSPWPRSEGETEVAGVMLRRPRGPYRPAARRRAGHRRLQERQARQRTARSSRVMRCSSACIGLIAQLGGFKTGWREPRLPSNIGRWRRTGKQFRQAQARPSSAMDRPTRRISSNGRTRRFRGRCGQMADGRRALHRQARARICAL